MIETMKCGLKQAIIKPDHHRIFQNEMILSFQFRQDSSLKTSSSTANSAGPSQTFQPTNLLQQ